MRILPTHPLNRTAGGVESLVVHSAEYVGQTEQQISDPHPPGPSLLVEESSNAWRRANGKELRHFPYHYADRGRGLERMSKIPSAHQKAERITRLLFGEEGFQWTATLDDDGYWVG